MAYKLGGIQDRTIDMQTAQAQKTKPSRNISQEISLVLSAIENNITTVGGLSKNCVGDIIKAAAMMTSSLRDGSKVVFFGNGGSAADAQHIAAELVGRFKAPRPPLRALALTTNPSILTAIGNDFNFDEVFSRQVTAEVEEGDTVIGITTSGRSKNVINGIKEANKMKAKTIGLTGSNGRDFASFCDHSILVPSNDTQRIQESHILIGHILCELIETALTR